MSNAQQPLHNSEGMPMCVVRQRSLEQELHSRKLYFCWSSALPNHCLKEADEASIKCYSQEDHQKQRQWKARKYKGSRALTPSDSHNSSRYLKKLEREGSCATGYALPVLEGKTGQMPEDTPGCPANSGPGSGGRPELSVLG